VKKRVAVLASGGGSNLQALMEAMEAPDYPAECVLVFSNKAEAKALERARVMGIETAHLDAKAFASREVYDQAAAELIKRSAPDYLCLAGYMRILTPGFIQAFRGRILNIHPALLPAFGGEGMYGHHVHEAVIKAGAKKSGATVHWVTEGVDAGPILLQQEVDVLPADTPDTLAARVLEVEHQLYPKALKRACGGLRNSD
jgi:phosphoribosylglycinamide formyltransferase-1